MWTSSSRRRVSHLFYSSLLASQLYLLLRRPFSPCKNSLALVWSSSMIDPGASGWCCLTLENSGYFVMPEKSELRWSTLVLRKVNSPSCKFKFSIVVLVEVLLQMVSVLKQSIPDSCLSDCVFSCHKPVKHTGHIPIFEGLGSLPKQGSFLCFPTLQGLLQIYWLQKLLLSDIIGQPSLHALLTGSWKASKPEMAMDSSSTCAWHHCWQCKGFAHVGRSSGTHRNCVRLSHCKELTPSVFQFLKACPIFSLWTSLAGTGVHLRAPVHLIRHAMHANLASNSLFSADSPPSFCE